MSLAFANPFTLDSSHCPSLSPIPGPRLGRCVAACPEDTRAVRTRPCFSRGSRSDLAWRLAGFMSLHSRNERRNGAHHSVQKRPLTAFQPTVRMKRLCGVDGGNAARVRLPRPWNSTQPCSSSARLESCGVRVRSPFRPAPEALEKERHPWDSRWSRRVAYPREVHGHRGPRTSNLKDTHLAGSGPERIAPKLVGGFTCVLSAYAS
jgi:hypothetical protein